MAVMFPESPYTIKAKDTNFNSSDEMSASPRYEEIQRLEAPAISGISPGKLHVPCGVAIDPNTNQIYVTEISPRVSIFSNTGEFQDSFTHEQMIRPWGIAVHRDNVYVTDSWNHSIFHFKTSVGIRLLSKLAGKGSLIGMFNEPRQLDVSDNGEVFVSDCLNHRIQILDSDLKYQRQISHQSMREPCDVKLTREEVYVLTYEGSPCVHVFTLTGERIRSLITSRGSGMLVSQPCSFCLDANENLIISDRETHSIKVFSKEGILIYTLGGPGYEIGSFYFPYGIALMSNRKLIVVSQNINYGLQIFSC